MRGVVLRWIVVSFVTGLGLVACIDQPEFHQVGESVPATSAAATEAPPPTTTTPPSTASTPADAGDDDDGGGDDPANYVPDGGVAGPGTTKCGADVCAVGRVCCSGKCKNPKSKC